MIELTKADYEEIMPVTLFKIGKTNIKIQPLGYKDLSEAKAGVNEVINSLKAKNVTLKNYKQNIPAIVDAVMHLAPSLLSLASKLRIDDVLSLPLPILVDLLATCIECNIQDGQRLESALKKLDTMIKERVPR